MYNSSTWTVWKLRETMSVFCSFTSFAFRCSAFVTTRHALDRTWSRCSLWHSFVIKLCTNSWQCRTPTTGETDVLLTQGNNSGYHSLLKLWHNFDRPYCHYKYSSILYFELFDVEECRDLERSLKVIGYDTIRQIGYWRSTVAMALFCIISEMKRDIGRKSQFLIPHMNLTPPLAGIRRSVAITFGTK